MKEVYRSPSYAPERVTGRYVRKLSGVKDTWRVFETATGTGRYAGIPGHGPTLREYDTRNPGLKPTHAEGTVNWPLHEKKSPRNLSPEGRFSYARAIRCRAFGRWRWGAE